MKRLRPGDRTTSRPVSVSKGYKNANIAILGTSGAGKSFTMQLMATRMRRKGIQVFIVAPLKGHEFHRACSNIGGEFIQISPASRNCINVMEIRKVDKSVDEMLDGPEQIGGLELPHVCGYCTVSPEGEVQYYQKE